MDHGVVNRGDGAGAAAGELAKGRRELSLCFVAFLGPECHHCKFFIQH